MTDEATPKTGLGEHLNASQLRLDTWHRLKYKSVSLVERSQQGRGYSELLEDIQASMQKLASIETYWAFPGSERFLRLQNFLEHDDYVALARGTGLIVRALSTASYRHRDTATVKADGNVDDFEDDLKSLISVPVSTRPYFEVLVVDLIPVDSRHALRDGLRSKQSMEDPFTYDIFVVSSFEDALIATTLNPQIQAVVLGPNFRMRSSNKLELRLGIRAQIEEQENSDTLPSERVNELARLIGEQRPEVDVYLVSDASVEDIAGNCPGNVRRVFYQLEDSIELHLNLIRGVQNRYRTPFFSALKAYSRQPTGVFHAMPISRGKSIQRSNWIKDMGDFYGMNIFLAETSATSGGLDSLLDPTGPLKEAQEKAARAFHADRTFFATNGTSTCNKIVVQALIQPGDIVLVDRDCHKSHHYGLVLVGAEVVYLDSYPLDEYSMYGAVPIKTIKQALLLLKKAGKLDRVKMLLLTNCTFDGVIYNVERVMQECLAIKPDLIFLWDEAWFGFAACLPEYRQRTAMWTANRLLKRYASEEYRTTFEMWKSASEEDSTGGQDANMMPDPDLVRVRVYACQSTHKTLTALRQGSMIHINDQDYNARVRDAFHEAYMTHTSTSPNYQILASLDIGRRQVELEGYELVQKQLETAMIIRERITNHPLISRWFSTLSVKEIIPVGHRESGIESYYEPAVGWQDFAEAWEKDEFVLDPTKVTVYIGKTGVDGDTFKNQYLMDKHGIQINKTSRNTVLFMTNIGTTRSSVAYLIGVLVDIAQEMDKQTVGLSRAERTIFDRKVLSLTQDPPPLPHFSYFHPAFSATDSTTGEGDLRSAFFLAYDESVCEYLNIEETRTAIEGGRDVVSAHFVTPYPPGFPILVPGQVVNIEILEYMRKLDVKEIHGYRAELGLKVFTEAAVDQRMLSQNTHTQ
jgi:arginine decarboxylase